MSACIGSDNNDLVPLNDHDFSRGANRDSVNVVMSTSNKLPRYYTDWSLRTWVEKKNETGFIAPLRKAVRIPNILPI